MDLAETCASISNENTIDMELMTTLETIFKSQACINASFIYESDVDNSRTSRYSGVNMELAEKAFHYVQKLENETLKQVVSKKSFLKTEPYTSTIIFFF